jgi:putative phosphoesterase
VLVGLIADTHGLVRPEALAALNGVDLILHGGDVGGSAVIAALAAIAPVRAVSGNTDSPDQGLPSAIDCTLEGVRIHVSHGHELGSPTPEGLVARYTADVIVYGHTHRSRLEEIGTTIVVNPGAAGPRRFDVLPSLALLTLPDRQVRFVRL